jgi:hypothetical protein
VSALEALTWLLIGAWLVVTGWAQVRIVYELRRVWQRQNGALRAESRAMPRAAETIGGGRDHRRGGVS